MELKINELKSGDRFWYKGFEYEVIGKEIMEYTMLPQISVRNLTLSEGFIPDDQDGKLFENISDIFVESLSSIEIVFTTKEESINHYLKTLEDLIRRQKERVQKEDDILSMYCAERSNLLDRIRRENETEERVYARTREKKVAHS